VHGLGLEGSGAGQVENNQVEGGRQGSSDSWYHPPPRQTKKMGGHRRGKGLMSRVGARNRGGKESKKAEKKDDPLQARFAPNTWKQNIPNYKNPPLEFIGPELGCTHPYGCVPSLLGLFDKFWSQKLQRRIVRETNMYASEVIDQKACKTRGGVDWTPLRLEEFRAYLGICLYMGIKRLPSIRLYWSRMNLFTIVMSFSNL
jgi:hypothetical protein